MPSAPDEASAAIDEAMLVGLRGLGPGRRLGRYELLVPVGRGGMAVVWAARLLGPHGFTKVVAIKTMLPALSADPRFEKMFLAEARFASTLEHPNVCEVLDLGETDGLLYLVMEWVQGDTLAALLEARGRLPFGVAMRIALDVAHGLEAAHDAKDAKGDLLGIVHRDVSPQNILVGIDGRSKIADFGIAKMDGAPATSAGYVKGKVAYMSPEQVYCEKVDRRTDVFALGVVLYEATTGKHPFAASTDVAILAKIAAPEPVEPPSRRVEGYPAALEAVVLRALAKTAEERFATMGDLATALEAACTATASAEVAAVLREACGSRIANRQARIDDNCRAVDDGAPRSAAVRQRGRTAKAWAGSAAVGAALVAALAFAKARGGERADASASATNPGASVTDSAPPAPVSDRAAAPSPVGGGSAETAPPSIASAPVRTMAVPDRRPPRAQTRRAAADATGAPMSPQTPERAPTPAPSHKTGVLETRD